MAATLQQSEGLLAHSNEGSSPGPSRSVLRAVLFMTCLLLVFGSGACKKRFSSRAAPDQPGGRPFPDDDRPKDQPVLCRKFARHINRCLKQAGTKRDRTANLTTDCRSMGYRAQGIRCVLASSCSDLLKKDNRCTRHIPFRHMMRGQSCGYHRWCPPPTVQARYPKVVSWTPPHRPELRALLRREAARRGVKLPRDYVPPAGWTPPPAWLELIRRGKVTVEDAGPQPPHAPVRAPTPGRRRPALPAAPPPPPAPTAPPRRS